MPEDQRIPGSPGNMDLSNNARNPQAGFPHQSTIPAVQPASPPTYQPATNNQTRNIFIGAFATILASTTVYYLTQYVNTRKSQSTPSYLEVKDATYNAWKRYVVMDNLYYKGLRFVYKDLAAQSEKTGEYINYLQSIKNETGKLADDFIKDAGSFLKEKDLDKTFLTMVSRRIKRENETKEKVNEYISSAVAIFSSTLDSDKKTKRLLDLADQMRHYSRVTYELGATEIEDLSKVLTGTYGMSFDPNEVILYADYKKGVISFEPIREDNDEDTRNRAKNIDEKQLTGVWRDGDNLLKLQKDGLMNSSLANGQKASGKWKIEDDLLRLDVLNISNTLTNTQFFKIYNIRPDSFTMKLATPPYDIFNAIRVKEE